MAISQLATVLIVVAFLVLGTQSIRLYLKTHITPAIFFALHFYLLSLLSLVATLGIARVSVNGQGIPYGTIYGTIVSCLIVVSALFFVYMLSSSWITTISIMSVTVLSITVWFIGRMNIVQSENWFHHSTAINSVGRVSIFVAVAVPLCVTVAAAFGTFKQMLEDGMHLLASVRLILIGVTQGCVSLILIVETIFKRSVFTVTPFVYSLCVISVVLALLSLLTPINTRQKVEHPIY